ncbi:hypothetical protein Bbelb_008240 [Branchiostoma belcheri]|nr:hypothetical protein Bbelb_008240 [Branchiostoma belcheri]
MLHPAHKTSPKDALTGKDVFPTESDRFTALTEFTVKRDMRQRDWREVPPCIHVDVHVHGHAIFVRAAKTQGQTKVPSFRAAYGADRRERARGDLGCVSIYRDSVTPMEYQMRETWRRTSE